MVERPPRPATSASACGRFKLEDLPHVPKNCRIKKTLTKPVYRRIRMLKRWLMSCPPVDFFFLAGGRLGPIVAGKINTLEVANRRPRQLAGRLPMSALAQKETALS
jgi:hypothetical protein